MATHAKISGQSWQQSTSRMPSINAAWMDIFFFKGPVGTALLCVPHIFTRENCERNCACFNFFSSSILHLFLLMMEVMMWGGKVDVRGTHVWATCKFFWFWEMLEGVPWDEIERNVPRGWCPSVLKIIQCLHARCWLDKMKLMGCASIVHQEIEIWHCGKPFFHNSLFGRLHIFDIFLLDKIKSNTVP
jgi:hypothetical protein